MAPLRSSLRRVVGLLGGLVALGYGGDGGGSNGVEAVIPTGLIAFQLPHAQTEFLDMLAAPSAVAGWGPRLPDLPNARWKHLYMRPFEAPADAQGCEPYALPTRGVPPGHDDSTMHPLTTLAVVDRGGCTFLTKAQRAEAAGARGLVIRGTKRAIYESIIHGRDANGSDPHGNDTTPTPRPPFEYDCGRGEAFVPESAMAEPIWATDAPACHRDPRCEARSCVLTGHRAPTTGHHQVCCLWDTAIVLYANRSEAANVSLPVVYVTVADGQRLERTWGRYPEILARVFERPRPVIDVAGVLLWALGVATALGATYYSAAPERHRYRLRTDPEYAAQYLEGGAQRGPRDGADDDHRQAAHGDREEPWELDGRTAVLFIVGAGGFLTLLYFVKVARVIPVLFALSATGTLAHVIVAPALQHCLPSVASRTLPVPACLGDAWPLADALGLALSAVVAALWYVHRRTCWYLQDAFGIVLCCVFLRTIQVPTLRVATILLTLAFAYDVFFVFLSPLVFGRSVMEDVATGGPAAYTRDDYPGVDYCERYPAYGPCVDPEPMPMLLMLPRVLDWLGGVSMLGLGDIILPGLALSFALRFDYSPRSLGENYFGAVAVAYAVGLALANAAVSLTQIGQPALMYLVPTCLGTLLLRARTRGDFKAMWLGLGLRADDEDNDIEEGHGPHHDGQHAVVDNGGGDKPRARGPHGVVVNDGPHDQAPLLGVSMSTTTTTSGTR